MRRRLIIPEPIELATNAAIAAKMKDRNKIIPETRALSSATVHSAIKAVLHGNPNPKDKPKSELNIIENTGP